MSYPERGAKYAGQDRAVRFCRADGGEVTDSMREAGKAKLQRAFQDRALEDMMLQGQSLRTRDSFDVTRDAVARGDYQRTESGRSRYKPWNPKRGED